PTATHTVVFHLQTALRPVSILFPYTTLFRSQPHCPHCVAKIEAGGVHLDRHLPRPDVARRRHLPAQRVESAGPVAGQPEHVAALDRKSTRLNSSHRTISYAVFCLKKKKNTII